MNSDEQMDAAVDATAGDSRASVQAAGVRMDSHLTTPRPCSHPHLDEPDHDLIRHKGARVHGLLGL